LNADALFTQATSVAESEPQPDGPHPPALADWTADDRVPDAMLARVLEHPHFPAAARALSQNMLDAAARDTKLDGIVKDAGRYIATVLALYLHVTGGLTLPRLKALCARTGLLSPGRARAVLIYLQFLGYIEFRAEKRRDVPARYLPTKALVDAWRLHLRRALEAARLIEPAVGVMLGRLDESAVLDTFLDFFGEGTLVSLAAGVSADNPLVALFSRHAGTLLRHCLFLSAVAPGDTFPPMVPIRVAIAPLTRQLNVSRVQIRRLLAAGVRAGVFEPLRDGEVSFTAQMRDRLRHYFALRLIGLLICAAKTATRAGAN
jgi:hypothetical protein